MKTANTTPRPATVTNPPLCANKPGAPAVVAFAGDEVLVPLPVLPVAEAEADAFPEAVELPLAFPVAVAFVVSLAVDAVSFAVEFPLVFPVAVAFVVPLSEV